ncbi:MAG: hypothetical protein FJX29_01125, partial [Alphaproteobacteria bacterium]|nr:hypothetical protein [Alphaproteobacteria bacterium]
MWAIAVLAFAIFGFAIFGFAMPGRADPAVIPSALAVSQAAQLQAVSFDILTGWKQHRARDVWNVFLKSCRRVSTAKTVLREGAPVTPDLRRVCGQALSFA